MEETLYTSDWTEIRLLSKTIPINQHDSLEIIGQSVSGTRTCLIIPKLNVVLDIGFCPSLAAKQDVVLVSHGHGDHIGALHIHAFDRRLHRLSNPTYVMPVECVSTFHQAHDTFKLMNRHAGIRLTKQNRIT